jgi:Fur family peroxide stress response transcriptional regulator
MPELKYDQFKGLCQASGLKATNQRYGILKILMETANHPTADSLFSMVRPHLPGLGRDTVYRTLNTLADYGLAKKLVMPGGAAHFDGNVSPHHHFLCEACGRIFDLAWPAFEALPWPAEAERLGLVNNASALLMGLCRGCRGNPES